MKKNLLFDVSTEFSNLTFSDFEKKFNINVNWINISKIYNEIVKLDSALYNKSNDDILTSLYQMNVINIIKKHVIDFLCEKYDAHIYVSVESDG